ncbi:MAG: NAD(P)/FAD-dependent oxidoreductase [Pseudomonadota bacterium]
MTDTTFQSIVIGGGSGGLSFARTAAKLGAKVLLIERGDLGGTCVNRGCVPKKILWSGGQLHRNMDRALRAGLSAPQAVRFAALAARRDEHIARIRDGYSDTLASEGVSVLRGQARVDGTSVTVDDTMYAADQVVIATGARPTALDIDGAEHLSDSDDVLSWTSLPARITIVGGGYVGCEFAAILAALGSDVTLVHDGDRILDAFPAALAEQVLRNLRQGGVTLHLGPGLAAVTRSDTALDATLSDGQRIRADAVVAAVGRTPNTDTLGPLSDALACADTGAVRVDARLATNVPGIHAVGDVADRMPLTPVATADGRQLAHMLHGAGGALIDLDDVTTAAFVYPPAAFVGHADDGVRHDTNRPLSDSALGPVDGPNPQLYRLGFDDTGRLTGAQIVADHAEDLITLLAALRASGATASDLARIAPIHPSFAEEFTGT